MASPSSAASSGPAGGSSGVREGVVMERILVGLVAALTLVAAHAQVPLILAEACALLDTVEKRSECLKVAATAGVPASKVSTEQPWDAVERAFIGLDGAIAAGTLSHNSYQAMLLDVSREVALFEKRAPDRHDQARLLASSLAMHQDALRFWGEWISFYSHRGNSMAYGGGLPMKIVGLEWMISRYALPTQKSDIWGINQGVQQGVGLRAIWSAAARESEEAFNQLKRPPQASRQ